MPCLAGQQMRQATQAARTGAIGRSANSAVSALLSHGPGIRLRNGASPRPPHDFL